MSLETRPQWTSWPPRRRMCSRETRSTGASTCGRPRDTEDPGWQWRTSRSPSVCRPLSEQECRKNLALFQTRAAIFRFFLFAHQPARLRIKLSGTLFSSLSTPLPSRTSELPISVKMAITQSRIRIIVLFRRFSVDERPAVQVELEDVLIFMN